MNMPNQGNYQGNHQGNKPGGDAAPNTSASPQGNQQRGQAVAGDNFVLVDSNQGLDVGDDQFAYGEVRRADRLMQRQSGSRQGEPDFNGTTGV